jgi:S-DNA-T family DNA segregation ATPase FtsK/SpoIIIE
MRKVVTGEQVAQIYNPDPFARPVWRAPVYQTPPVVIAVIQLCRLLGWLIRLIFRHRVVALVLAVVGFAYAEIGWPGMTGLVTGVTVTLAGLRLLWPVSFARWVAAPARNGWRAWRYRRRWAGVMMISGLAPGYQGRLLLPVLGRVSSTRYTDRVRVRLVSGQSPGDFAKRAENLAHGFGAMLCRVRTSRSGALVLEFVRRDALAQVVLPAPMLASPDLRALEAGRREDGLPWHIRLHGTHVLVAGATGAGKASLLWSLVRAMFPLMQAGLVRVLAADPKLMELAFGRAIFDRYGAYAADTGSVVAMLERAVADMQARAAVFAGWQRDHTPTEEHPFTVVLVDEVAFLTAYQPDRKLRERVMNALATLTTQGRAVGYCVVAALQDPRKDVLTIRNLFPDRIAMRLDEPEQTDMVLGDGARDRGAACELISSDPAVGAGVAFVRTESDPDPVRVRAGWVSDHDILTLASYCRDDPEPLDDTAPLAIEAAA